MKEIDGTNGPRRDGLDAGRDGSGVEEDETQMAVMHYLLRCRYSCTTLHCNKPHAMHTWVDMIFISDGHTGMDIRAYGHGHFRWNEFLFLARH